MEVFKKTAYSDLATVFLARNAEGKCIEFVESTQPPFTRQQKWVLIISTLFGCPVKCSFCDAGGFYDGKLSKEELLFQVDYLIRRFYPEGHVPCGKFKIQFARMGEPAFNPAVLDLIESLPGLYSIPGFIPSLSTIAPAGRDDYFERLLNIKKKLYRETFQLQFSIHSTDEGQRDRLIPVKKWGFGKIAEYGRRFYDEQGKKITLNFALASETIIDPGVIARHFDPQQFLVKLTPVNPTFRAKEHNITSLIHENHIPEELISNIKESGFEVILSIGEWEENLIGSNCGQYVQRLMTDPEGYGFALEDIINVDN